MSKIESALPEWERYLCIDWWVPLAKFVWHTLYFCYVRDGYLRCSYSLQVRGGYLLKTSITMTIHSMVDQQLFRNIWPDNAFNHLIKLKNLLRTRLPIFIMNGNSIWHSIDIECSYVSKEKLSETFQWNKLIFLFFIQPKYYTK